MGGNTGETQIGSERELYKYINHHVETCTKKARSKNNTSTDDIQYGMFGLGNKSRLFICQFVPLPTG